MTPQEIEAAARKLYDECWTVKPDWDKLGDVTKKVWMDKVVKK